jgi:hypothetical protein
MVARQGHGNLRAFRGWALVVLAAAICLTAPAALVEQSLAAGELDKIDSAVKLVPADAAFFVSRLHAREQIEAIAHSHAWAKLMGMPAATMLRSMYEKYAADPSTPAGQIDAALKNPEVQKVLELLAQMGSEEAFVYGGDDFNNFLELLQDVASALRYEPAVLQMTSQTGGRTPQELQARLLVSTLATNLELLDVPSIVFGFKLKNTDLAKEELIKLEMIANMVLGMNDRTKGRFKKANVGGHEYLTLQLDGGMLPWDKLPVEELKKMEKEKGDAEKIIRHLKSLKLVLALGLRGNYLLASIGPSSEGLEQLGKGERLIDRPEMKPLAKFADKRLVSIAYMSEDMNQQISNNSKAIDDTVRALEAWLPTTKLKPQQQARIRKDAEALATEIKQRLPKPGAVMGFAYLTPAGVEGYQRAWGARPSVASAKPLTVLQHVGGDPILGAAARLTMSVKDYDGVAKWIKTAYGYFKEFGLPNVPEEHREKLQQFLADVIPSIERLDKANRTMLIPALADGQVALVLDAKLKSKHFIEFLPATDEAMPMIEPALVVGVSNAKLLEKACSEYRAAVNGILDAVGKIEGIELPGISSLRIPEPKTVSGKNGKLYAYPLPEGWGVDKQIAPHMAVAKDVAVVAMSQAHAERLLKATPLKVGGVLKDPKRPLAGAAWLRWSGLIDAIAPWVNLGTKQSAMPQVETPVRWADVASQTPAVLELLKVLQTISSESYVEDEALVTHTLLEVRDIK